MAKPLDRIEVPKFYATRNPEASTHPDSRGQVFAESDDHFMAGRITVGYVSRQTPLGQGTFLGFPRTELRDATRKEVFAALDRDHPFGRSFRPDCREAMNANFHLVMSRAVKNWTNDDPGGARHVPNILDAGVLVVGGANSSILNVSRSEIQAAGEAAQKKHDKTIRFWGLICWKQSRAIRQAFAASSAPIPA
jgi:hypothetical protein